MGADGVPDEWLLADGCCLLLVHVMLAKGFAPDFVCLRPSR